MNNRGMESDDGLDSPLDTLNCSGRACEETKRIYCMRHSEEVRTSAREVARGEEFNPDDPPVEVALSISPREEDSNIGLIDMGRGGVGSSVNCNGTDSEFFGRLDNPGGNLAPIGYQQLLQYLHARCQYCK